MAFLTQRIIQACLQRPSTLRDRQERAVPDKVVLPVREGFTATDKPPVRIFLGTEAAQYKAERVFIWSIEQVRDPSRVYEIYLMKHLYGFRSRFWLTGFTNYRFAIPHFAGKTGRAIYNDVDQIYLQDPAELFDLDMDGHGYLAVDAGDISVALFDCEQMAAIWTLEKAQAEPKNKLLGEAKNISGLWGKLATGWNARDREYVPGESGVLHYTALHRQPWYPFPQLFVYHSNQAADVWNSLEQSANQAGFQVFSAEHPSPVFSELRGDIRQLAAPSLDAAADPTELLWLADSLELIPDEDIPWVLESLFERADAQLDITVNQRRKARDLPNGRQLRVRARSREWWQYQLELIGRHYPTVRWRLHVCTNGLLGQLGKSRWLLIEGNECRANATVVWVLANRKPGHTSQATALATLLGWPYKLMTVPQRLKALLLVMLRCNFGRLRPLQPPWPNIIVACGWWPTRVARWVQRRSGGRTRLLLAGRKAGPIKVSTDIVVSCEHFHLPVHERRVEVLLPVQPTAQSHFADARAAGEALFGDSPTPRVALLVGGSAKQHVLTADHAAQLGQQVLEQVTAVGGSLFAVTSRRTGHAAAKALQRVLNSAARVHCWSPDEANNPYPDLLAAADIIVVTGESESMLADAVATGKPVYICPLKQRSYGPWLTLGRKLSVWSGAHRKNRRGTERPQQGFQYLCSRILKREVILPPRDLDALHQRLVERGLARMFGQSLEVTTVPAAPSAIDLRQGLRIMLAQPQNDLDAKSAAGYAHQAPLDV